MKLKTTLFGETYRFDSVRDVLNKAGELRSGDVLAGVAASSMQERVAAKQVLSELTLGDLRENPVVPYEDDAITRVIQDAVHTPVYGSIRNWTVAEFREFLLDGRTSAADIERVRKGRRRIQDYVQRRPHLRGEEDARGGALQQYRGPAGAVLLAPPAQRHAG